MTETALPSGTASDPALSARSSRPVARTSQLTIAVFRALQLGDMLVAVPALRAIRTAFPDAEITLIGLPWATPFVDRFNRYVDRFVEFGGYPGIAEVPVDGERVRRILQEQRAYGYDIAVQMHGSGSASNPFVLELGAGTSVGYYLQEPPAGLSLGAPYPDDQPEILRNLGLARLLGASELRPDLEFPVLEEDRAEVDGLLDELPAPHRPLIGVHAGATAPARRWPAEHFAAAADGLARRFGAQIVLTGGTGDAPVVQEVAERMEIDALNLAGRTSLGGLAALIERMDLFVSNDTGPAHLACAVDTLSITIFGPVDPRRWAPLDLRRHRIVRRPVACSPCPFVECPIDHRCLRWLEPRAVVDVARQLLLPGLAA